MYIQSEDKIKPNTGIYVSNRNKYKSFFSMFPKYGRLRRGFIGIKCIMKISLNFLRSISNISLNKQKIDHSNMCS